MATRNPSLNIRPDLAKKAAAAAVSVGDAAGAVGALPPGGKAAAPADAADVELRGPRGNWWWTGREPPSCPGFDKKAGVLRSLPLPNTRSFTRQSVLDYFDNTWTLTEVLLASMQGQEAFTRQPYHQLRHPMMFYYGHPAVLYVNKFRVAGLLQDGIDQYIEQLFETGVDEMSWDDLSRAREDWPSVRTVHAYRQQAYRVIRKVIETHPCLDVDEAGWDTPAWAVFMGFEHERIHIETSSVLLREMPLEFLRKPEYWPDYHPSTQQPSQQVPVAGQDFPHNPLLAVGGERVVLGKDRDYPTFGWDNEYGRREITVQPFRASKFKITNGEFLQFVKAGGYRSPKFWSQEGWGWKTFRNVKWPTFWIPDGPQGLHKYKLRVLFDAVDMRWDWPVDVNYHEAKAFAAWATERDASAVRYRLITEAEHQLIRNTQDRSDAWRFAPSSFSSPEAAAAASAASAGGSGAGAADAGGAYSPPAGAAADESLNPDFAAAATGLTAALAFGANVQLAHGSQNPVTELAASQRGFHDAFGNAWEWAEDHFAAYPGFRVHPYYDDFSAPCFAGKHQMIIGGSFISTGQLASKFARYQFRPHFFQHATFRMVLPSADLSLYDGSRYGPENPLAPFVETSCMDAAPPHVGDGPCCSRKKRAAFTSTLEEERSSTRRKLEAAQVAYESDEVMAQYLSLHFGPFDQVYAALGVPSSSAAEAAGAGASTSGLLQQATDFPARLGAYASQAAAAAGTTGTQRALDLGCAVGGTSFELARTFTEVVGIDISKTFIEVATKLRDNKRMDYDCKVEGEVTERLSAAVHADIDTSRVRFLQGDACSLPQGLGLFDVVVAGNLLCRVPEPRQCLQQIRDALKPGGVAVITSPFSWLEQYTDRSNWLGGRFQEGAAVRSAEALRELATSTAMGLQVLSEDSMPLLIREHARKYQLIVAHRIVLRRN